MSILTHQYLKSWEEKKAIELAFWQKWLETKGMEWPDDFNKRMDPSRKPDPTIQNLIASDIKTPKVLDIGSGPLTDFCKELPDGRHMDLYPIDPHAEQYNNMLEKLNIQALHPSQSGSVENLSSIFPEDHFDFVYMRNALDHCYDPFTGIEQILKVTKPGAYIFLAHRTNLAARENYEGTAIWNISAEKYDFIIWNTNRTVNISREISHLANTTLIFHENWIDITIQKKND